MKPMLLDLDAVIEQFHLWTHNVLLLKGKKLLNIKNVGSSQEYITKNDTKLKPRDSSAKKVWSDLSSPISLDPNFHNIWLTDYV